jgi:tetratricopeptide (TPR) repeat protein
MLQGQILYEKGYYVQAKNIFESLKVTVQTSELYEYIGLCEYKLNNYAEALNNIDKAIILRDDVQRLDSLYNEIKVKIEAVD